MTPFFVAWGATVGLRIVPGTLNLSADREVLPPDTFIPLRPWDHALTLREWKAQPGYDPRLYEVVLDRSIRAWLFRWSAPGSLHHFSGKRSCEVIAEVNLTETLGLTAESTTIMAFV